MNTVYLTNNLLLLKLRIMWQINCVGPPFTDNQPRLYQSHINVFLCVCFVYVYVYVCACVHVSMCVCIFCMCVYVYVYVYVCACVHVIM